MSEQRRLSRRSALKSVARCECRGTYGRKCRDRCRPPGGRTTAAIDRRATADLLPRSGAPAFIDTHEHLCDEQDRLPGGASTGADDWTVLLSGYLGSDLRSAGMPGDVHGKFCCEGSVTGREMEAAGAVLARRQEHRLRSSGEDFLAATLRDR